MTTTDQAILPTVLDSTQIVCFRTCPQKFYNEYVCGLRREVPKIDLHAGSVFAKVLEDFQKNVHLKKLTTNEARAFALHEFATEWGEIEAPSDSPKSMDRMWEAFEDYVRTYPPHTDHVQPYFVDGFPTFEFTFAIPLLPEWGFPLHPKTGEPFVYAGRFDMLGQWAGRPVIRDEKTTKYMGPGWSEQWDLRSQFIGYCLPPETEILTPLGWSPIGDLEEGTKIAQWDNGTISFVMPSQIHRPHFKGNMIKVDGKISLQATPDHRQVLLDKYDNRLKTYALKDLPWTRGSARFITSGYLAGPSRFSSAFLRLIVAAQADARFDPHGMGIRFSFTKDRKKQRLAELLLELNIKATETESVDGVTHFNLSARDETVIALRDLLGNKKEFGSWLLELSGEEIELFVEELKYWDGCDYKSKILYSTKSPVNANWVITLAHLCNRYASWHSQKDCYRVVISKEIHKSVLRHDVTEVPYDDTVYCVTVPSSYFLIRHNGVILVTGNCWAVNQLGLDLDTVVVRGIAIQKTQIKQAEAIKMYSEHLRQRWFDQLVRDVNRIVQCWNEGYWDFNLGDACNQYGRCQFTNMCSSQHREAWASEFTVRRWNPLTPAPLGEMQP